MIVITVCFKKDGKNYQYLLHNPGNHKIDKNRPLVYTKGILYGKPDNVYLYPVSVERVEALPPIVTAQITLLSADNVIRVERIGKITDVRPHPTEVKEPAVKKPRTKKVTESVAVPKVVRKKKTTTTESIQAVMDKAKKDIQKWMWKHGLS